MSQDPLRQCGRKSTVLDRCNLADLHTLTLTHRGPPPRRRAALVARRAEIYQTKSDSFRTSGKETVTRFERDHERYGGGTERHPPGCPLSEAQYRHAGPQRRGAGCRHQHPHHPCYSPGEESWADQLTLRILKLDSTIQMASWRPLVFGILTSRRVARIRQNRYAVHIKGGI
jgi:hypothetical protein